MQNSLAGRGEASEGRSSGTQALRCLLRHISLNSQPMKLTFPKALVAGGTRVGHEEVLPPCGHFCNYNLTTSASVQFGFSCVRLFATPWTAASQGSWSITNSQSPPKLMSHRVGDAIQLSHPLSSRSPPTLKLSQHQGVFK